MNRLNIVPATEFRTKEADVRKQNELIDIVDAFGSKIIHVVSEASELDVASSTNAYGLILILDLVSYGQYNDKPLISLSRCVPVIAGTPDYQIV